MHLLMKCPECGNDLPDSSIFCFNCKTDLTQFKKLHSQAEQNNNKKGGIGCLGIIGIVIVIGIIANIFEGKKPTTQEKIDPRFNDDYKTPNSDQKNSNSNFWNYVIKEKCLAGTTEENFDQLVKFSVRKDQEAVMMMVAEGKAVVLNAHIRVRRMSGFATCKVKVVSGDLLGDELFVACENLEHSN
jgi:hypothetical protein